MSMSKRAVGKNGPQVPVIGFGAMGLSSGYGSVGSNEERFKILDRAIELGSTFWDTSDVYADNEDLIGAWFKYSGKRDKVYLCTKFGVTKDDQGQPSIRSDPDYVRKACERSMKRLGVERIDLWFCHRVDMKTPIEDTVSAMAKLKHEGKIGAIGLSEVSARTLRRAYKVHPIAAVQVEYSPFSTEIEDSNIDLLRTCRELGVTIIAYSPLGRGFLTGQIKSPDDFEEGDFRKFAPRYSQNNFPKNLELVKSLEKFAAKKGCTPGQLSLAWILAQGDDIIPIPGTKKIRYLEENVAAAQVQLSAQEVEAIRKEIEKTEIVGERYPPWFENYSFADTPELQDIK
ncbi:uncharacterized protein PV09_02288 [Verruconis gallopava]|uniref:NADP-dependent oxidoreductase domain-containing protein n=1 Tax=Verruconis gallopava TaxID=253628 RepID=A0A0D2B8B7_9PEZI|nr:uncharacterized protein PV09_02288 [Verruconis gallopava]KIW07449.1 hypothetical protein PV09_02288 [Verruconis gallopava]